MSFLVTQQHDMNMGLLINIHLKDREKNKEESRQSKINTKKW